jgi:hypothetical protein
MVWVGTRKQITLVCALKWMGLSCSPMDIAVYVKDITPEELVNTLREIDNGPLPEEHDLARYGSKLTFEKHDYLLNPFLKRLNFASAKLDLPSLQSTLKRLLDQKKP